MLKERNIINLLYPLRLRYKAVSIVLFLPLCLFFTAKYTLAAPVPTAQIELQQHFANQLELFKQVSTITGIPWSYLAAIDQYEFSLRQPRKLPVRNGLVHIHIEPSAWAGPFNPIQTDMNPDSIALFGGIGKDGSGDGLADSDNDLDLIIALTSYIAAFGKSQDDLHIGLWEYYQNARSVQRIGQFAKIYQTFGTLDLYQHAFPLPTSSIYSFRSTWGERRGWGGLRIHEGIDLFADHGTPVQNTSYGIIEIMGWNPFGGWRIGIRDLNNVYHYYAHLSGFNKKLKKNDIVTPGQVIGWVGSSGYGKPGTSGKFPPHLHYGQYRDRGLSEWAFDPYSSLRKWEREDMKRHKSAR